MGLFLGKALVAKETADNHGTRSQANWVLPSRGQGPDSCQGEGSGRLGGQGLAEMGGGDEEQLVLSLQDKSFRN